MTLTNKWSPLQRGELLHIEMKHIEAVARFATVNLRLGHAVQFAHDDAYASAGWEFTPSADMSAFDRTCLGHLHDDKVAGFTADGSLSKTHTVSNQEKIVWENQRKNDDKDVIIHSFVLLKPFEDGVPFSVQYCAPCSWQNVRNHLNTGENSFMFYREGAVMWSPY